jgi:hypothetical protein
VVVTNTSSVAKDIVNVSWVGVTTPAAQDRIGLFVATEPDDRNDKLADRPVYTDGSDRGTTAFEPPADLPAGTYQLRQFRAKSLTRLAVS